MAGVFNIPKSNTLRFVRNDAYILPSGYLSDKPNFDNRLMVDESWAEDTLIYMYEQKIHTGKIIVTQFISDYTTHTFKIYDSAGTMTDLSSSITEVFDYNDGSGKKVYNLKINTAALGGDYYALITAAATGMETLQYKCDTFNVDNYTTYPYLEWYTSDTDGITYTGEEIFAMNIEAYIGVAKNAVDKVVHTGFDGELINLKSSPKLLIEFTTDPIPRYQTEKLTLAFDHETVKINDVYFQSTGEPTIEIVPGTNMFTFKITIQQVVYEDYTDLATIGEQVVTDDTIAINETDQLLSNATTIISVSKNGTGGTVGASDLRTSALEVLDMPRLNYDLLIDNENDPTQKSIPIESVIPYKPVLQEIGAWNMATTAYKDVTIDFSDVVSFALMSLLDDTANIHSMFNVYDILFHGALGHKGVNIPRAVETSSEDSTGGVHSHQYDAYGRFWSDVHEEGAVSKIMINSEGSIGFVLTTAGELYKTTPTLGRYSLEASDVTDFDISSDFKCIVYCTSGAGTGNVFVSNDYGSNFYDAINDDSYWTFQKCSVLRDGDYAYWFAWASYYIVFSGIFEDDESYNSDTGTALSVVIKKLYNIVEAIAIGLTSTDIYYMNIVPGNVLMYSLFNDATQNFVDMAKSSNNLIIVAVSSNPDGTGCVYYSTTGVANLVKVRTSTQYTCVALSWDGTRILAGKANGSVDISKDGGVTWETIVVAGGAISSVTSNLDGSEQYLAMGVYIYESLQSYSTESDPVLGGYQGQNIEVGAVQIDANTLRLFHNYPGSVSSNFGTQSDIGQLANFVGSANRGHILLFKTITS